MSLRPQVTSSTTSALFLYSDEMKVLGMLIPSSELPAYLIVSFQGFQLWFSFERPNAYLENVKGYFHSILRSVFDTTIYHLLLLNYSAQ